MKLVKFCCACAAIALSSSAFSQGDEIQGDEIIVTGKTDSTGVYREQSTPANPTAAEGKAMRDKQKKVSEETAKAREKAIKQAKLKCRVDNLATRMACMNDARALNERASVRCDLYAYNALIYAGIATTGVAVVPAVIVGGGFTIAAMTCASDAEGALDKHLQACQDTFDSFELVCSSI